VPKRVVDFTNNVTPQSVVLADKVQLVHWQELTMLVKVHSVVTSGGTISIRALPCSYSPDDPGVTFVASAGAGPAVILDANVSSPNVKTGFLRTMGPNCVGDMIRIVALGNKTSANALNATISVELSAKDGTSCMPTRLASCVLWLHADDYNPLTGDWPDRSGAENHGSQLPAGSRPTKETNFNGFTDVLFNGSTQYVTANGVATRLAGTDIPFSVVYLYELVSLPGVAGNIYGAGRSSSNSPYIRSQAPRSDGGVYHYGVFRSDDVPALKFGVSTLTLAAATKYSVAERFSGAPTNLMNVSVNGASYLTGIDLDVGALTLDQMNVGAYAIGGTAGEFLNMRLREFAVFNTNISDPEMTSVVNGMRERAGLPCV
jgi:hypothetical protein